jgi:5-methylcytosine-specific restriction endonuclease McrA
MKPIDLKTPEGRNRFYSTPEWQAVRRIVLTAYPYCVECMKEGYYTVSEEIDHIVDLKYSPERCLDTTNLQALCKSHHSAKTYHENKNTTFGKKNIFTKVNMKWNNLKIN